MTAAIADFALSDEGRVFAAIADRWGVDPGVVFPDDDVLAWNLRGALMVGISRGRSANEDPDFATKYGADEGWAEAGAANEREWLSGV